MIGIYLLHKILLDNRADLLVKLNRRWLLSEEERQMYVKIKKHLKKYASLPKPDSSPLGFTNEPIEYYLDEIKKRYILHAVNKLKATEITSDNVEKVINKFINEIQNNKLDIVDGIVPEDEFNKFVIKTVEDTRLRRVSGLYGFPTGYPTIDVVTGGFIAGDIFVISARLKKGKTMYLLNMMRKIAKEHSCMFISMEMSIYSIVRRLLYLETKIPQIVQANRIVSSFHDNIIKSINLKVTLVNGASIKDVYDIMDLIVFYKPEIVFIDGAYLIPTERVFKSEWERAKYIIEELRRIALVTTKPIVCTYQLNRQAVKSKEPQAEHIAFTDAIAQSASVVLAIGDADVPSQRKFYIIANREGDSGINIRVHFDWNNANFEEVTDTSTIVHVEDEEYILDEGGDYEYA